MNMFRTQKNVKGLRKNSEQEVKDFGCKCLNIYSTEKATREFTDTEPSGEK